jgi:hypothetical protein
VLMASWSGAIGRRELSGVGERDLEPANSVVWLKALARSPSIVSICADVCCEDGWRGESGGVATCSSMFACLIRTPHTTGWSSHIILIFMRECKRVWVKSTRP